MWRDVAAVAWVYCVIMWYNVTSAEITRFVSVVFAARSVYVLV